MHSRPTYQTLSDGRAHFSHGPIDLVIGADGPPGAVAAALDRARDRFDTVLAELVDELPALRRPCCADHHFSGSVARRMAAAVAPFAGRHFITPMAAVAGAVADEICAVMRAAGDLDRIHVNNGGDIALHLSGAAELRVGLVCGGDQDAAPLAGRIALRAGDPVRGVATSGRGGRSLSLGIADAVTVLAPCAALADAAATLIANAVDVDAPAVERVPACELDPDSDLGHRLVTVAVGRLASRQVVAALERGAARAEAFRARGLIHAAALGLAGELRLVGGPLQEHLLEQETAA